MAEKDLQVIVKAKELAAVLRLMQYYAANVAPVQAERPQKKKQKKPGTKETKNKNTERVNLWNE